MKDTVGTVETVVGSYVKDLCEGVKVLMARGVAYLLIGKKKYPIIEGSTPPLLHFYVRDGCLTVYSFWRDKGEEHEAAIKVTLDKVHIIKDGILVEPHGALKKFDAFVLIKITEPKGISNLLDTIIKEEEWKGVGGGEVASTYLEEYLKKVGQV
ncbi:hypothetical protein [Pyrococcus horikoshii]|uniref:Uncharacterized protein n=2 Tax=Pyrococcus horikoshii TaxID=53953 RepID=O57795_PYRHO|nr:hypothetical protein [Pyrococcus horikoshii]BAA29137.1 153aa long hypothetical protein [Pyrococcus horikoshii OT3]HII61571.1 hypothetical protein [Pyrococcus horikoshii]